MRRLRDESGVTLIELLMTMVILTVVLGMGFSLFSTGEAQAPREQSRTSAIKNAQVQLDRMTRELRQAIRMNGSSYNYVDFDVSIGGTTRRVMYDCRVAAADARYRTCTRYEGPQGGALGSGVVVINRLLNGQDTAAGQVFNADDQLNPRYVEVRIEVPASEGSARGYGHKVVLDDGVYMRNLNLG